MFDMKAITILIIGFFSVGCASTTQIVPLPTGAISAPNNGIYRIILYRVSEIKGGPVGYKVIVNDQSIDQLGQNGFLYWDTEPGFKTLEAAPFNRVQTNPGWKQFTSEGNDLIVLKIELDDWHTGHPLIRILSGAEKEKLLSELKSRKK